MAPEIAKGRYSSKCDVFSLGILLWELSHLIQPWRGLTPVQAFVAICDGERLPLSLSPALAPLAGPIVACTAHTPTDRPTLAALLAHLTNRLPRELLVRAHPATAGARGGEAVEADEADEAAAPAVPIPPSLQHTSHHRLPTPTMAEGSAPHTHTHSPHFTASAHGDASSALIAPSDDAHNDASSNNTAKLGDVPYVPFDE